MPDQLTDDQLEDLFADLRARELHLVRPPGAAAVRSRLRRRRQIGSATAAALAVLGITGLVLTLGRSGPAVHTVSPSAATGPLSEIELAVLTHRARDTLERGASMRWPYEQARVLKQDSMPLSNRTLGIAVEAQAGRYTIAMRCAGDGRVDVKVRAAPITPGGGFDLSRAELIGRNQVRCHQAEPANYSLDVELTAGLALVFDPVADDRAIRRAGFAYRITRLPKPSDESLQNAAAARLAVTPAGGRTPAVSHVAEADRSSTEDLPAGTEPIRVSCVGPGTINVTVTAQSGRVPDETFSSVTQVHCRSTATVQELPLNLPAPTWVTVDVVISLEARNHAGYAYLLPQG